MLNKDIYLKDPKTQKLVNEGVVKVSEDYSKSALEVLRYELEIFVCDGQYEKGLEHVLDTYLKNIEQAQQPGVWISGFYGSGKSHLVKMLRALWENIKFTDGSTAREIANLPSGIKDLLTELNTQGRRHGGIHAASGTLGSGVSGSVRLALLGIFFKSAGLPVQYPVAKFIMWLKQEDIFDEVKIKIEKRGANWEDELDNFHVAEDLHAVLSEVKPNLFSSPTICTEVLNNQYPSVQDISSDDLVKSLKQAISIDGKFPLTFIGLDEVQQYIGENTERAHNVQEVVEICCKNFGGKLLFVGTGQTAVTGTPYLKKLEGRFTIRVELSDTDVDSVVRQVILAKKPDAIALITKEMEKNLGEISRHLNNTTLRHTQEDVPFFSPDYPVLPVRRRFWENTFRVLDPSGTESQLRNQLSMVHEIIKTNLDKPVAHVVPADYLYFDSAEKLLQARMLPRKVYEKTISWSKGTENERLLARSCGLVFLINKLSSGNKDIGIQCTVDTLADLLVEDLKQGSGNLRSTLPKLLDECELLMKVDDEYRIQTEESAAWTDEFQGQLSLLTNEPHRIESERNERIRSKLNTSMKRISLTHGKSKVARSLTTVYESQLPGDSEQKICMWVRDGWETDENSVKIDALQAGNQSPTIFVFIPKRSADDLRYHIRDYKAATITLDKKGVPTTPEGIEARAAMETTKQTSDRKINELLDVTFENGRVFQGGGNEITGLYLTDMIQEAAQNSMQRLYPQFAMADHPGWDKVYSKAKTGAPDALKAVGYDGEPVQNPVCKIILGYIAGGKKGNDIRNQYENDPFGWSRDAIDGALQVLLIAGVIHAQDDGGKIQDAREYERKLIGKLWFKVESQTVTTAQRIQVRKLLQRAGFQFKQGEESATIGSFIQKMLDLSSTSGGEAPKPERPDTSFFEELRLSLPNEQIITLANQQDDVNKKIESWTELTEQIDNRQPKWEKLNNLLDKANDLTAAVEARQQVEAIKQQRLLLSDPDPIQPLLTSLEKTIREELTNQHRLYSETLKIQSQKLDKDLMWNELTSDEQQTILDACGITEIPELNTKTYDDLIQTLTINPVSAWEDRITALPGRFTKAREKAAIQLQPDTQPVDVPRRILKTDQELQEWLKEVEKQLKNALVKGPVMIR